MYVAIKEILKTLCLHNKFTFSTSPQTNSQPFEPDTLVFDLKSEEHINNIIQNYSKVISIHCKQIFPAALVQGLKCYNLHPGYNPINRGWYPQVFSIITKNIIGATLHEIDDEIDSGRIIAREILPTFSWDTSLSIYNQLQILELKLFEENIVSIIEDSYNSFLPEGPGNIYFKKDFQNLCELDLSQRVSISEALDLLRALSHSPYKNAFYVDPKTKKKVFVSLTLRPEA